VVFSVLEGILLKPLPYPHSQELVGVSHAALGLGIKELPGAPSNYFIYRDQNQTFQEIGMYTADSASVTGPTEPEQVRVGKLTDGLIPTLGIPPALGRGFNRQDDLPGSPDTVVLMYAYWQRKFGGRKDVLGKTIQIGQPCAACRAWRKTATWAERSRYQKATEGRSRYQAMPPTAPAPRLSRITPHPTAIWTPTTAYIRPTGSGFRLMMRKSTM